MRSAAVELTLTPAPGSAAASVAAARRTPARCVAFATPHAPTEAKTTFEWNPDVELLPKALRLAATAAAPVAAAAAVATNARCAVLQPSTGDPAGACAAGWRGKCARKEAK